MVVLITGATGGLGQVLGQLLLDKGETVYGTSRNPEGRAGEVPFPLLTLDVSSQDSVDACLNQLVEKEGRIDVLVNCVNEMVIGSVEEADVDEVAALYDTNVFGVMRLCRSIAGIMKKQGGGTVVNMSSLGGLLAVPLMSSYTSSKFALEAFSEAFYQEMKREGIDVVIMQPVAMRIDRPATGHHLRTVTGIAEDSLSHRMVKKMARDTAASKLSPEMVSEKIYQVITADKKPLRVPMDKAKVIGLVKRLAPQSLIDRLVNNLVYGDS